MPKKPRARPTFTTRRPDSKTSTGTQGGNFPVLNRMIRDLETPGSMLELIPDEQRIHFLNIPDDLIGVDEDALREILRDKYRYTPTQNTEVLRSRWWQEHDRVQIAKEARMSMVKVYAGNCHRETWEDLLLNKPHILAYILCKPPEYEAAMSSLLDLATRTQFEILAIPTKKASGEYQDVKLLELKLKAAAMVDLRVRGGYIQRSETKNLNLINQQVNVGSYTDHLGSLSRSGHSAAELEVDIDKKMKELEAELAKHSLPSPKISSDPGIIDVESTDVS